MALPKLMAVWEHDSYPYFLCGEITGMEERGYVETKEFGKGNLIKPTLILPYNGATAKSIREGRETLLEFYEAEVKNHRKIIALKRKEILPTRLLLALDNS